MRIKVKPAFFKWRHPIQNEARLPPFTGTCPVRQHTGDGGYVGRCEHSTYAGHCHLHGDVSRWLLHGADLADADDRLIERPAEFVYGSRAVVLTPAGHTALEEGERT